VNWVPRGEILAVQNLVVEYLQFLGGDFAHMGVGQ
jgi:hypothetical protein